MAGDLRNNLLNERVLQGNVPASEFLREDFVPESGGHFISCRVARDDFHVGILGLVILEREERKVELPVAVLRSRRWISREKPFTHLHARHFDA